jgi:hypothetical protein
MRKQSKFLNFVNSEKHEIKNTVKDGCNYHGYNDFPGYNEQYVAFLAISVHAHGYSELTVITNILDDPLKFVITDCDCVIMVLIVIMVLTCLK